MATVGSILSATPAVWQNEAPNNDYPIQRTWQWKRNGVNIPDAVSTCYTLQDADVGQSITVTETAGFISSGNNGTTYEVPAVTSNSASSAVTVTGSQSPTLVYPSNLTYKGAFKVPIVSGATDQEQFVYGGFAMAFNPNGSGSQQTITLSGFVAVAPTVAGEISVIPNANLVNSTNISSYPPASYLRPTASPFPDPLEGQLNTSGIEGGILRLRGMLHVSSYSKLLVSACSYFQNGPGYAAMWRRPSDVTATSQVEGPFCVYDSAYYPRFNAGWMCNVPSVSVGDTNYQTALGGDVLTGLAGVSIAGKASNSPSIAIFSTSDIDPALPRKTSGTAEGGTTTTIILGSSAIANPPQVNDWVWCPSLPYDLVNGVYYYSALRITAYDSGTRTATVSPAWLSAPQSGSTTYTISPRVPAKQLSGYAYPNQLQSGDARNFYTVHSSQLDYQGGMVFPNGTRSVLVFGYHGSGVEMYGTPGNIYSGKRLYDYAATGQSFHATPYALRVWAYNADELVQVKNGTGGFTCENIKPYAVWDFTIPNLENPGVASLKLTGVTYNPVNKTIYLAFIPPPSGQAVIHAFEVSNATYP
jgi:hypothetical protein